MSIVIGLYRRCSGCGCRKLERRAEALDIDGEVVTGMQRCTDCGRVYLYARRLTKRERETGTVAPQKKGA